MAGRTGSERTLGLGRTGAVRRVAAADGNGRALGKRANARVGRLAQ